VRRRRLTAILAVAAAAIAATSVYARSPARGARASLLAAPRSVAVAPPPQLLVRLREDQPLAAGLSGYPFLSLERALPQIHALVERVTAGTATAALAAVDADPRVASVDVDKALTPLMTPNDPLFYRQWDMQMIQAPYAWETTRSAGKTIVAVLDSGVDLTHPDLAPNLLPIGCDVISDGACPANGQGTPPEDQDGHGSAVAGIIAAAADSGTGIAGVAWHASLLPVRVTTGGTGTESDFITGLLWAVDQGAKVVNLSFGEACGTPETAALQSALGYASAHGVLLVAAAGNDGGCPQGIFPAADPRVLAVTATDRNDAPTATANYGPWVAAAAPGDRVLSTYKDGQYVVASGTSLAAPHVAGLAALLFGAPGANVASVRRWILSTCDVPSGWNPAYGCGRINAYRAVSLAFTGVDPHSASQAPVRVHLSKGWNNLLYLGPTRTPEVALASLSSALGSVYGWDPARATWTAYLPSQTAASDLPVLQERGAYWLYMSADADLVMQPTGTSPPAQITLSVGWNNLGLPAGRPADVAKQFSPAVAAIFGWDSTSMAWRAYVAAAPEATDLSALLANAAYWVYAPAAVVVRFPP